jgi:hypothetical protein
VKKLSLAIAYMESRVQRVRELLDGLDSGGRLFGYVVSDAHYTG